MSLLAINRIQLEVICADPPQVLKKLVEEHIAVFNVEYINQLKMRFWIFKKENPTVTAILDRYGCSYSLLNISRFSTILQYVKRRPILVFVILVLMIGSLLLPTRIWFVRVEGNQMIPENYILTHAQLNGVYFGAARRSVRSEKVKNALMESIPELQWVGINTKGCVATIHVEEKSITGDCKNSVQGNHIVALLDGVIYSCTVEQGSVMCKVGQAVKKDQLLVSGYIDSGLYIALSKAKAEIFAITNRDLTVLTPSDCFHRTGCDRLSKRYSLIIGKKLIKLYNESGIYQGSCVKMYSEEYMTLPGGFQLPIVLITEFVQEYDVEMRSLDEVADISWLEVYSNEYILHQMIAGKILLSDINININNGVCRLFGQYACLEMIGINKTEENWDRYGENE